MHPANDTFFAVVPRLFLIDGSSQMYRAYHAIRGLTGPDGKSTNAVYGFTTMLRKLIADHNPDYIAASFDLAGPTFRDALAADYKANRAPMPSDLAEQVPLVREACEAMGVPVLVFQGFEADDVIGTLAIAGVKRGFEVAIVTGDKDFFQLVDDSIRVYNPRDEGTWYDAAGVVEKFGVRPDQVVDVLALMGDSIDNIKGVPGIGEKGARDLIAQHGDPRHAARRGGVDLRRSAIAKACSSTPTTRARAGAGAHPHRRAGDVRRRGDALPRTRSRALLHAVLQARLPYAGAGLRADGAVVGKDYAVVGTLDELDALAASLQAAGRFSLAPITEGASAMTATIAGWTFSTAPDMARYVPMRHSGLPDTPNFAVSEVISRIGPLLADPAIAEVGHDLKFAMIALGRDGVVARRHRARHRDRQLPASTRRDRTTRSRAWRSSAPTTG